MNKTEKIALREAIIVVLMGAAINFPLQTFLLRLTIDNWECAHLKYPFAADNYFCSLDKSLLVKYFKEESFNPFSYLYFLFFCHHSHLHSLCNHVLTPNTISVVAAISARLLLHPFLHFLDLL